MKQWKSADKKERIRRWERVVKVLRGLSKHERRKHWDMSLYGVREKCGTIACAAGHCGLDPWFRKRGFKLIPAPNSEEGSGRFAGVPEWESASARFFGDAAWEIFEEPLPRSVGTVIKECLGVIKELKAQP